MKFAHLITVEWLTCTYGPLGILNGKILTPTEMKRLDIQPPQMKFKREPERV
jgi:hypothetical protein